MLHDGSVPTVLSAQKMSDDIRKKKVNSLKFFLWYGIYWLREYFGYDCAKSMKKMAV